MKLNDYRNGFSARRLRTCWALQHRSTVQEMRSAERRIRHSTAPRWGRSAQRYDVQIINQMRGKRRAMGAK